MAKRIEFRTSEGQLVMRTKNANYFARDKAAKMAIMLGYKTLQEVDSETNKAIDLTHYIKNRVS